MMHFAISADDFEMRWSVVFVLSLAWNAAAEEPCLCDIAALFNSSVKVEADIVAKAGTVLGRNLSATQAKALQNAAQITKSDVYTSSEVLAQDAMLKKAGLTKNEIAALRRKGVLGNSVLKLDKGAPTGFDVRQYEMHPLGSADVAKLSAGTKLNYLLGEDGSIYVTIEELNMPSDKLVIAAQASGKALHGGNSVLVHEAGELRFDSVGRKFTFRPTYGFDSSEIETNELINNVTTNNPGLRVTYQANPKIPRSRAVQCLDILSAQSAGRNFLLDRLISDNLVMTSAIIGSEMAGAHRLDNEHGQRVVVADIIGNNIGSSFASVIGKNLVLKNSNFATSMAVRSGMGLGMIDIQKDVHKIVLNEQGQDHTAEDIAAFNRVHFFARLPLNHYIDQFFVKTLPNLIFDTCQTSPTKTLLISPRSMRIYERYSSSILYYGLRGAIIGQ